MSERGRGINDEASTTSIPLISSSTRASSINPAVVRLRHSTPKRSSSAPPTPPVVIASGIPTPTTSAVLKLTTMAQTQRRAIHMI
ncbi:hypothetical protein BCR33DRAFT_786512 [Rhizoclosmatium globosum]|uniref:Uncharacterized protein n=1 Tax=Rhizoclosmatium globosum TaxID=329046 RepID=A0A1Y2C7L3_9FUNG|nr:hypothetical protein BCR33DRAFT_786512 [Rhizoclosmatium globosum]|eukprot:ORY42305.1 hypothetical protein BCR33DRAFT_786512 [Rhizoclosmatium globosum]